MSLPSRGSPANLFYALAAFVACVVSAYFILTTGYDYDDSNVLPGWEVVFYLIYKFVGHQGMAVLFILLGGGLSAYFINRARD